MEFLRRDVRYRFQIGNILVQNTEKNSDSERFVGASAFKIQIGKGVVQIIAKSSSDNCISVFIYNVSGGILGIKVLRSETGVFPIDLEGIAARGQNLVFNILTSEKNHTERFHYI